MDVVVVYGTGSGTTAQVSDAVAEGMKLEGVDAFSVKFEYVPPARVGKADMIGIGTPVHFYREARYIAEFLAKLPDLTGKRAFAFCTCGMDRPGETLARLHAELTRRGATVVGLESFRSAMSYFPHKARGLGNPDTLPDEAVFDAARAFGKRMAAASAAGPVAAPRVSLVTRLKAKLVNGPIRRKVFPAPHLNLEKCTGYGSCLSRCQVHGLDRVDGEIVPFFTDACVQCLECINWCPRGAIEIDSPLKERLSTMSYRLGLH